MAKKKRKKKAKKKRATKRTVKRTVTRVCPARKRSPAVVAKSVIAKVAQPGAAFSASQLKTGLRKLGYRDTGGWMDQMIADAKRRRLLSPVSKTTMAFTPAAARLPRTTAKRRKK